MAILRFVRFWLPVIVWTILIALESTIGSSANTGSVLYRVITAVIGQVDPGRFEIFHHLLRKCGHFFGYGILGWLWFRAFTQTLRPAVRMKCASLAIVATFITASLDEWHQSFSSARTGQFSDVLLDTCGALVLIALTSVTIAQRWRSRSVARA